MTDSSTPLLPSPANNPDKALTLALRLVHAENALQMLASGQVDAVVDPSGKAYLLRPAQESLRQSESRFRALLDSIPDAIVVVNRGGVIVSHSRSVGHVLRLRPESFMGRRIFERIHEEDLRVVHSAFFNVIEEFRENASVRFHYCGPDGSYHLIEATVGKLRDAGDLSAVFSLRRIADLQPGKVELPAPTDTAFIAKDRFLAMLSHELRTPLAPLLFGIEELRQDERFAAASETLTMMRRNVELQSRLLDELSDFIATGQDKIRLRLHFVDAHELVHFVLDLCRSEISAAQIEVRLDLRATHAMVLADSARLQQVMWNLVKNAVKFSARDGSISIASSNDTQGRLILEIIDHGIGIEPELLPLIFDPFRQGDLSMQSLYGGLGLGMFIAKALTEAHQGTLTVTSEGRGHGATFRLILHGSPPDLTGKALFETFVPPDTASVQSPANT
jgi:PAS domain S-box-containing protein